MGGLGKHRGRISRFGTVEIRRSLQDARRSYSTLSKHHQRRNSAFLPMASRRSETVCTEDASEEYARLCQGKWHLRNVANNLDSLTASVFEPLDEDKLKQSAIEGLREKAMERMRFEGVSERQQKIVMLEMTQVLEEQIRKRQNSKVSDDASATPGDDAGTAREASSRDLADAQTEPLVEPSSREMADSQIDPLVELHIP